MIWCGLTKFIEEDPPPWTDPDYVSEGIILDGLGYQQRKLWKPNWVSQSQIFIMGSSQNFKQLAYIKICVLGDKNNNLFIRFITLRKLNIVIGAQKKSRSKCSETPPVALNLSAQKS